MLLYVLCCSYLSQQKWNKSIAAVLLHTRQKLDAIFMRNEKNLINSPYQTYETNTQSSKKKKKFILHVILV